MVWQRGSGIPCDGISAVEMHIILNLSKRQVNKKKVLSLH